MERRFEFQDFAALGAVGVGIAVGMHAGVTTKDVVTAFSGSTPVSDITPPPLITKSNVTIERILKQIKAATSNREQADLDRLNRVIAGGASSSGFSDSALLGLKTGLLEFATSPQVPLNAREAAMGSDVSAYIGKVFSMDEVALRAELARVANVTGTGEIRKTLGSVIGTNLRSKSSFKGNLSQVSRIYNMKTEPQIRSLNLGKIKENPAAEIRDSLLRNMSASQTLDSMVRRYPLNIQGPRLSSDFSHTFGFRGPDELMAQIRNTLTDAGMEDRIGSTMEEVSVTFKKAQELQNQLKSRGILPSDQKLTFTIMGVKGMDRPAIYLNMPIGEGGLKPEAGRHGFQIPLTKPNLVGSDYVTPIYFRNANTNSSVLLNSRTARAPVANVEGANNRLQLMSTLDYVFYGGKDAEVEDIPFFKSVINSIGVKVNKETDPVLLEEYAKESGIDIHEMNKRVRESGQKIFTSNPLDSLFGTSGDQSMFGQAVVGDLNAPNNVQLARQRGRIIGIVGAHEFVSTPGYTATDLFSLAKDKLDMSRINYGGKIGLIGITASSVSPGQVGIEKGGVSAISFNLINPEFFGLDQEELRNLSEGEYRSRLNDAITNTKEIYGSQYQANLVANTHYGLLNNAADPEGFNQGRRPSQPLVDVFSLTEESVRDLDKKGAVRIAEVGDVYHPLMEFSSQSNDEEIATRLNRRYLLAHPMAKRTYDTPVGVFKSSLQEGLSIAVTGSVDPSFYGQARVKKLFLGSENTLMNEKLSKVVDALRSLTPEQQKDAEIRKSVIWQVLENEKDGSFFRNSEFLGLELDQRKGLQFSTVDFGSVDKYNLEDAYLEGERLALSFRPVVDSQQASKVMLGSKTTQVAMSPDEALSVISKTTDVERTAAVLKGDEGALNALRNKRIDAIAGADEIGRAGNLNMIRAQQASALVEVLQDKIPEGVRSGLNKIKVGNEATVLRVINNNLRGAFAGKNKRLMRFTEDQTEAIETILKSKRKSKGWELFTRGLRENKVSTMNLLEVVSSFAVARKSGIQFSSHEIFSIFGLEKADTLEDLIAIEKKGKYHAGFLSGLQRSKERKAMTEAFYSLTSDEFRNFISKEEFSRFLKEIGTGLNKVDYDEGWIRGQVATTFRTSGGAFQADQVSIEKRAIQSLVNLEQFKDESSDIDFKKLFLDDLSLQLQGPSQSEANLAGRLMIQDGFLNLTEESELKLTPTTGYTDKGRSAIIPFLENHVKGEARLYIPNKEEISILQRQIGVGEQIVDKSYYGQIENVKQILGELTQEDMDNFDPNSVKGQKLIEAFNEAKRIANYTAASINERFYSGAIIGSIYTLNQASYELVDTSLKLANSNLIKQTKGGALVDRVNRREAMRLLEGARRTASREVYKELEENFLVKRNPVLEIGTRSPTITGTPRFANLVQYDPDLDFLAVDNSKGEFVRVEGDQGPSYRRYASLTKEDIATKTFTRDSEGNLVRYMFNSQEVRRAAYGQVRDSDGTIKNIYSYMLSGTTTDHDGDNSARNLYVGADHQRYTDYLSSEKGTAAYLSYIEEQTNMQNRYEGFVKNSIAMNNFEESADRTINATTRALSQHAGQSQIGSVSTAITQMKTLAVFGMMAKLGEKGESLAAEEVEKVERSMAKFFAFAQGLEQVPISFKHSSGGATPAQVVTEQIYKIFESDSTDEAIRAMEEFLTQWTTDSSGKVNQEAAEAVSDWMEFFMKNAVGFVTADPSIKAALRHSTLTAAKIANMSPEEFMENFKTSAGTNVSEVIQTEVSSILEGAINESKAGQEVRALNESLMERARAKNRIESSLVEQESLGKLNSRGRAIGKIAGPIGAGLVAAGLIYSIFDRGHSADNLEEPGGRDGLTPPAGISMNATPRDANLNIPYEDREMNFAPNTLERKLVGSSNTGRLNSRAQISQNVNANEVARAMQATMPHAQIGVNLQYSYKMNPRLEQDL